MELKNKLGLGKGPVFHKNIVFQYWKKRNHPREKHVKSMQCSLYRLNFQYYLQLIKEHKYHESKYPQLILCMLCKTSVPQETYQNQQCILQALKAAHKWLRLLNIAALGQIWTTALTLCSDVSFGIPEEVLKW